MNGESFHEPRPEGPVSRVERQLAIAQEITHIGSWEWDARTNAVRWSDELYRIYGLEPQSMEITFDTFLAAFTRRPRSHVGSAVAAGFASGGALRVPGADRATGRLGPPPRHDGRSRPRRRRRRSSASSARAAT